MSDGNWSLLDQFGIRLASLVAGLAGGILSLSMLPRLTFRKALTAVFGGAACAAYVTPLAVEYLGIASRNLENGMAFGLGVVGMNILGGVFALSERWRDNPSLDPEDLKNIGKKDGRK